MKKKFVTKNPYLIFLPFLIIYLFFVLRSPTTGSVGDEGRYLMFASNLLHGFYSPPSPDIDLGNGPGYAIFLIPFLAFHLPLITITLLNACFYYLSVVFLFKACNAVMPFRLSLIAGLFWALFLNMYEYLPIIYTESFTVFLISLILFNLIKGFNSPRKKTNTYFSGFLIGFLALTKPIFGYVMMFLFLGTILLWLFNRQSVNLKKSILMLLVSFLTVSPYLAYTYHLTGRIFYWGSNGGNNLYWMSTPFAEEYGNWIEYPAIAKENRISGSENTIMQNHQKEMDEIYQTKGVEQDDLFKKIAIQNIKSHPLKFAENWFSNIGRMLFNFPYSYKLEKPATLLRIPFNGILLFFILLCIFPTSLNWKQIDYSIRFLLFFSLLYLGGSTLGSAETRMFTMIVPVLLLWIGYILNKSVRINLKFKEKD